MTKKICGLCKQEKPVSEFYTSRRCGYQWKCKPCHLGGNKGYLKEYFSRPEIKERANVLHKEYRKRPDVSVKDFARQCLANEIRARRINREPCVMCGAKQSHGHHEDYNQPLLIVWLCATCHRQLHVERRS